MSEFPSESKKDAGMLPSQVVNLGGFDFEHVHRNEFVEQSLAASSKAGGGNNNKAEIPTLAKKTGTTIAGLVYKDGVVLGADTRATNGSEVVDKLSRKIDCLAPNIYCCGAGTAADTEKICALMASQLELLRLNSSSSCAKSRVVTACTLLKRRLFQYQGYISAALVLGGCDFSGKYIYQIYPNGYTARLPYTTMGSGSLAAIATLEAAYVDDLPEEDAVELMKRAILAGISNDLGSGSNVDICVIRTDGTVTMDRGAVKSNQVEPLRDLIAHSQRLTLKPGTTSTLSESFVPFDLGVAGAAVEVTEMET